MREQVRGWFGSRIESDDLVRQKRLYSNLLGGTIGFTVVIVLLFVAIALLVDEIVVLSVAIPPLFMLLVLFVCLWLNYRGAIALSQRIFLGINFVAIVATIFLYDGFTSSAVLLLLWPIVLGGVLIRPGFAFVTSILASLVGLAAYLLELAGVYTPVFQPPPHVHLLFTLSSNVILFNVLAAFLFMVIRSLDSALVRERVLSRELQSHREQLEQKVVERTAELRRLKEFNEEIIQNVAEGVLVEDAEGYLTFANPAAASILGYELDELLGLHWTEIIPPEQHFKIEAADQRRVEGQADRYETLVMRKDGTHMPVLVSGSPRLDPDIGEFAGTMAVFTDIVELKQAEEEREKLLLAEREQRLLAETLRDVTLALTSHTSHTAVLDEILQQVQRIVPYCAADISLLEAGVLSTVRWKGYDQYGGGELIANMVRAVGDFPYDKEIVDSGRLVVIPDTHSDSQWLILPETAWIRSALLFPLRLGDQPLGTMNLASDQAGGFSQEDGLKLEPLANAVAIAIQNARLVEDLEAEVASRTAEIRDEKEKSEIILRNVGSAIGMANLELHVQYVNEAFEKLTGYASQEVIGKSPGFLLFERMSEQEQHLMQVVLLQGEIWQRDVMLARKDGRISDATVTVVPMHEADGNLKGYVFSLEDISQRKELDRARSQFMTTVSHELRTPATNMKLYSQLLQRNPSPHKVEQYLQTLHVQAERMSHLVQDIVEMTALDSGQAVRAWMPINLHSVVRDIQDRFEELAQEAEISLFVSPVPNDLDPVHGDLARLGQALAEVVENAITFSPAGGRVTIDTVGQKEGGKNWVTISVCDTGDGINLEEQERIFDRFYRGSLAESGNVPGTGLGLSMVEVIMQAHGGRVTVESQLGHGSTFTLWLPAVLDEAVPASHSA